MGLFNKKFPHYIQLDMMDCGPTCLRIIAKSFGRNFSARFLREATYKGKAGVSILGISDAAEKIGLHSMAVRCSFEMMRDERPTPFIAHWNQKHFVVVYKIDKKQVYVSDPAQGLLKYSHAEFKKYWCSHKDEGEDVGVGLLLDPTPKFYESEFDDDEGDKVDPGFYLRYLKPHTQLIFQLAIGLAVGGLLTLALPFLTQGLVDHGIQNQDMTLVYGILIAQIMMYLGQTSVEVIRSWLMLHISTRINISIISDFLSKLMKLPIGFFDSKNLGDLMQRMSDHQRIEMFLTGQSLSFLFSLFSFFIYSAVILTYSVEMFGIFAVGGTLYIAWILIFLKQRAKLDYKRFQEASRTQSSEVQLIQGMQAIKLNQCERQKRWEWERIQVKLFKVSIASLSLEQYQSVGSGFINQLKNVFISFWAAKEVIEGNMTLGMMMAATQIIGQLDQPIMQFVQFIRQGQDALISMERLGEIHNRKEEEEEEENMLYEIPPSQDLVLKNLSFRYGDPNNQWVLENLNLSIPWGKTTAIVGESGSGKTTLLKLLLKFYAPEQGEISYGNHNLSQYNPTTWRTQCGVVMQEGFIFSDTIARNIAVADEVIDKVKLVHAIDIANAREFIEALPLSYNTKIGSEGLNLSTGQKQRIMIARAIYKNPDFLFFDEATSSLDAQNEREITEKLDMFKKGRTSVIIAHRLSTVKNADQIIVLSKGKLVERGTHEELIEEKGKYFELIKNQLELGN